MDREVLLFLLVLIPSVILHEVAHGVTALHFGDDTAKRAGRLTLNPIPHVDPFGTILLPLALAVTSLGVIGYAKPVPVDPRRLRSPRQHLLYVSMAGPATNVTLAVLAALALHALDPVGLSPLDFGQLSLAAELLLLAGFVNTLLAVLNALPIPPLDGAAVIERFLPRAWWPGYQRFRQYSLGMLLVFVLLLPGSLNGVFEFFLRQWLRLI